VSRARTVAAAVLLGLLTVAGSAGAESRYSLRGDGEYVSSARADVRAMAGAEAASDVPSLSGNPAGLSLVGRTTFYGTYDTEWIRTEERLDDGNRVRKDYSGLVPNLALLFPLPGEVALGTGLLVGRRRGGEIEQTALVSDGYGGQLAYRQDFEGRGSVLRIPLVFGRAFGRVQVGAGADLILLSREDRWRNDFDGVAEDRGFIDSDDTDRTSLHGAAWRAGVRVPVGEWLALGGWAFLPGELHGEHRLESRQAGSQADFEVDASADYAPAWAFGFQLRPPGESPAPALPHRVLVDWVHEDWESADALSPVDELANVDRFALGAEWLISRERGRVRWPLRVGYRTQTLPVPDSGGNKIREHQFSLGSGFDIAGGRGDIDWYAEYGWRGGNDDADYLEHFVRFGVTLTGWEEWTRRRQPPEDDDW